MQVKFNILIEKFMLDSSIFFLTRCSCEQDIEQTLDVLLETSNCVELYSAILDDITAKYETKHTSGTLKQVNTKPNISGTLKQVNTKPNIQYMWNTETGKYETKHIWNIETGKYETKHIWNTETGKYETKQTSGTVKQVNTLM